MTIKDYIKFTHKFPLIDDDIEILEDIGVKGLGKPPLRGFNTPHVDVGEYDTFVSSMNSEANFDIEPMANTPIHGPQGKKGSFDGVKFDSIWEYAYYRYKKDVKGEYIEKNKTENLPYFVNGRECKFYPDFKVSTGFVEIKGIWREKDLQKQAAHPEVEFLDATQIKPIIAELNKKLPKWRDDYL